MRAVQKAKAKPQRREPVDYSPSIILKTILNLGSEFLMEQNKFVIDSNYNKTEVPADLLVEQTSQSSVKVFAARSKANAKPQKREPVYLPSIIPMNERKCIDIEPGDSSLSAYEVSKKVIHLLRHSQIVSTTRRRRSDSIWENKKHLQSDVPQIPYWSDDRWKACLAAGGGAQRRYQYCSDISGTIVYSEFFKDIQGVVSLILHYKTM